MVIGMVKEVFGRHHLKPFARGNEHIGHVDRQIAYHALKHVAAMPVDDEQTAHALMIERGGNVGENGLLGLLARMDAKLQVALTGILRSHRHRCQHHRPDTVLFECYGCRVYRHIVREDGICKIGKMQIMGLGGPPRQYCQCIIERLGCAIVAHT